MGLELVSGADFWCKLMSGGRPVDLGGPGVDFRAKTQENRPENFDFYPLFMPSSWEIGSLHWTEVMRNWLTALD